MLSEWHQFIFKFNRHDRMLPFTEKGIYDNKTTMNYI